MSQIETPALEAHPFANMFPMMKGEPLDDLVASIKRDGLLEPVVLFHGQILDGRNRFVAGTEAGIVWDLANPAHFKDFSHLTDAEALAYVESRNMHRRHLTPEQRAMAAAEFAAVRATGNQGVLPQQDPITKQFKKMDGRTAASRGGVTNEEAGKRFSVHPDAVRFARKLREEAEPNIVKLVEDGELKLGPAKLLLNNLTPAQQRKIDTPEAAKKAIKKIRAKAGFDHMSTGNICETLFEMVAELGRRPAGEVNLERLAATLNALRALHASLATVSNTGSGAA